MTAFLWASLAISGVGVVAQAGLLMLGSKISGAQAVNLALHTAMSVWALTLLF